MIANRPAAFRLSITFAALIVTSFVPTLAHAQQPKEIYIQRCAACHGDKGHGDGPAGKYLQPPPADLATALKGKGDDWIAKVIKSGGASVGISSTMMPNPNLSDAQVNGLVAYIKQFSP
jgi:mono/diheme cytochrome c family protein